VWKGGQASIIQAKNHTLGEQPEKEWMKVSRHVDTIDIRYVLYGVF
jgi:hypothetical protein